MESRRFPAVDSANDKQEPALEKNRLDSMLCEMEMIFLMLSIERSAWSSKVRSKPREPKCVVISLAWRGVAKVHKS